MLAKANEYYKNGNFTQAVKSYETLTSTGFESVEIYYNLGNAYFKTGNVAASILNYERALRLAPSDEDIEWNLAIAHTKVIDKIEPAPQLFLVTWWRFVVGLASAAMWGWIAVAFIWLLVGCGVAFILVNTSILKKILFTAGIVCLCCAALTMVFSYRQYRVMTSDGSAIVFTASVPVKSAPQEDSKDLFVLHEGTKVEIIEPLGEWKKIRIADGSVGWLRANTIQVI